MPHVRFEPRAPGAVMHGAKNKYGREPCMSDPGLGRASGMNDPGQEGMPKRSLFGGSGRSAPLHLRGNLGAL